MAGGGALKPSDIAGMGNFVRTKGVAAAIESVGSRVAYLPPDRPDFASFDRSAARAVDPAPIGQSSQLAMRQEVEKRRARDSNPQPLAGHLISSQTASHSRTLRA